MKTICFTSKKGGVSKTTSAIITGLILSENNKVLLIDLDSQNALTSFFFDDYSQIDNKTILESLKSDIPFIQSIHNINDNLDVIPCKLEFESINEWERTAKEFLLTKEIDKLHYDYVIIDTPPSLRVETILALLSANTIIIPAKLEKMDLRGIDMTMLKINNEIKDLNAKLDNVYILPTQYNHQNRTVNDIAFGMLKKEYPEITLEILVKYSSKISKLNFLGFNENIILKDFPEYYDLVKVIK